MNLHDIFRKGFISTIITLFLNVRLISGPAYWPAHCVMSTTSDGLEFADCTNNPFKITGPHFILNDKSSNVPASVQVLDGSGPNGGPSAINIDEKAFDLYPKLRKIILRNLQQYTDAIQYEIWVEKDIMEKVFVKLNELQYLEVVNSSLNESAALMHLPRNLVTLNVSDNKYSYFDASGSEAIEELNANNNILRNIPKVHFTRPPLHKLSLKRNPLDEMTVLDVAPLCELNVLEVDFPAYSRYASEKGYCDCEMLKRWTKEVEVKGFENIQCVKPAGGKTCSESVLAEARSLHKRCPLLKKYGLSSRLFTIIKYVFFIILFLLMLAVAILYVIRHFHLREWYAQHHFLSHAHSIKMEEGEEEPFSDPDSSEDASEMSSEQNESYVEE